MEHDIPVFGPLIEGAAYRLRPGAYAVIHDEEGRVAVVRTPEGIYLPGGGIESGESPEEALVRETLEECGLVIRIEQELGMADQLISLTDRNLYVRKRGIFYLASVAGWNYAAACEPDHELLWISQSDAAEQLAHESQRMMVMKASDSTPARD